MKKKKNNKAKTGFAMRLLKIVTAAFAVLLVVSFINGRMQVSRMERELQEVNRQVEQQREANEELRRIMRTGDEDAYVERVAREKLGYARPGERVFVDITGK